MDFFMQVISDRVEADNVLRKVSSLIDWKRVGWKVGKVRSKLGRAGYDVDLMVRVMLLGQWHSLSDRELESYLDRVCGEDSRLRREVLSYLDYDTPGTVFTGGTDSGAAPEIPAATTSETRSISFSALAAIKSCLSWARAIETRMR